MLLWAQVNLNKGIINGKRIYSEASYGLLTTPQVKVYDEVSVGLSWFISNMNDTRKYSHSGGDLGYSSYFGFIPEKQAAIVMMENVEGFPSARAANVVLRNAVFNDSTSWQGPISYKLKDYILADGIEKVKEVYFTEKNRTPSIYATRSKNFDNLGYWLIDRGHFQEALEVFLFNTELEPEDAGWVDSVADAYVAMDSTDAAIRWYRKALAMDPGQDFSREKLDDLLLE